MITEWGKNFISSGGNSAGFIDLHPALIEKLEEELELFQERIVPAMYGDPNGLIITMEIKDECVILHWRFRDIDKDYKKRFRYNPIAESTSQFVDSIKSFYYDMATGIFEM